MLQGGSKVEDGSHLRGILATAKKIAPRPFFEKNKTMMIMCKNDRLPRQHNTPGPPSYLDIRENDTKWALPCRQTERWTVGRPRTPVDDETNIGEL